jgi:hypothetical protein
MSARVAGLVKQVVLVNQMVRKKIDQCLVDTGARVIIYLLDVIGLSDWRSESKV